MVEGDELFRLQADEGLTRLQRSLLLAPVQVTARDAQRQPSLNPPIVPTLAGRRIRGLRRTPAAQTASCPPARPHGHFYPALHTSRIEPNRAEPNRPTGSCKPAETPGCED